MENDIDKIIKEKDLYKILNVNKESSTDEIRKAYKKLAIKYHPDKNKTERAADAFKKISHAFSVLSDENKKKNYDMFGSEDGPMASSRSHHFDNDLAFNIFQQMFRGEDLGSFFGGMGNGSNVRMSFSNGNTVFTSYSFGGGENNFGSFQRHNSSKNRAHSNREEDIENSDDEEGYMNEDGDIFFQSKSKNHRNNRSNPEDFLNEMLFGTRINRSNSENNRQKAEQNSRQRKARNQAETIRNRVEFIQQMISNCCNLLMWIPIIYILINFFIPKLLGIY